MKKSQPFIIIFVLGLLDTITPLTIDMYLPAFSTMADDFSTTTARVSLSLTSYFVGFGIGQIIYGPLLDKFGRHKPMYFGTGIYILACAGCALSPSVEALIGFRFLQAMGASASAVGVRAMVRDYFTIEESPKIFSMLMLILSVSPLLAPSLGSVIASYVDWPWIFGVLAVLAFAALMLMKIYLPEVYRPDSTISLRVGPMLKTFADIFRNRQFTTYTIATSFKIGGLFVYLAGSTVILLERFHVTPTFYAILFALQSIGLIVGNQLNIYFLKRFPTKTIFKVALTVQVISASFFLLGTVLDWYGIYWTVTFFFILLGCLGMTFPNGSAIALAPFTDNIGSASALMGCLQIAIGGLVSGSIGLFNANDSFPVALMIFLSGFVAWIVLMIGERKSA